MCSTVVQEQNKVLMCTVIQFLVVLAQHSTGYVKIMLNLLSGLFSASTNLDCSFLLQFPEHCLTQSLENEVHLANLWPDIC